MENMDEKSGNEGTSYVKELWATFEKTGSIGAYLLYNTVKDKTKSGVKGREKNNTLQK